MKERAPSFQFFPRQFTGDDQVTGMDLDAIGAHILLMCYAAASPERYRIRCRSDAGSVPEICGRDAESDAAMHSICMRIRNPSDESWEKIKTQLLAGAWKISADGQFWEQDGLKRTFMKQKEFSERQAQRANAKWCRIDAESMPDRCRNDAGSDAGSMPEVCSSSSSSSSNLKPPLPSFNSAEVAQVLCQANGWSGPKMIWALKDAIEYQSKGMPESSLEQAGEWLVKAYREHEAAKGKFAVGPQRFFSEGRYQQSKPPNQGRKPYDPAEAVIEEYMADTGLSREEVLSHFATPSQVRQ